jgi:hypothetical protein
MLDTGASPTGAAFQVTDGSLASTFYDSPRLDAGADGRFVIVWHGNTLDDDSQGILGRSFDASGAPGDQFLVNSYLFGRQFLPDVSLDAAGNAIVAFQSRGAFGPAPDIDGATVLARRFCDEDDPTCDLCLGFDDSIDVDADGVPDGCDPCTNVAGARDFALQARLSLREVFNSEFPSKSNKARLSGEFTVPGGFAALDPVVTGLRVRIENAGGGLINDVMLPGGLFAGSGTAGWKAAGPGAWHFLDRAGLPLNGIGKVQVKDRGTKAPERIKITVKGRGGAYPNPPGFEPVNATVTFGAAAEAMAGICGETVFVESDCENPFQSLSCKR